MGKNASSYYLIAYFYRFWCFFFFFYEYDDSNISPAITSREP